MDDIKLCFVKYIGNDINGENEYEFLFTDKIDEFWGDNFEYMPSCLCNELVPFNNSYNVVKKIKTNIRLSLIQNSCCFSFQDAIDGIVAIAFEDISDYEEYPQQGRLILNFGDEYDNVIEELKKREIFIED